MSPLFYTAGLAAGLRTNKFVFCLQTADSSVGQVA